MRPFDLFPAETLIGGVPSDLPASQLYKRNSLGRTFRLFAVGDVGFSGRVAASANRAGVPAPLETVSPVLRTGDIIFGNLETPFVDNWNSRHIFSAPVKFAPALAEAGFTILNLANNHICDHGPAGLEASISLLNDLSIQVLGAATTQDGARQLVRTDLGEIRIGWFGCAYTGQSQPSGGPFFWEYDPEELRHSVKLARRSVDILIVSIHIGLMYLDYPDPAHRHVAHTLLEAGCDLILMHHAHVLQGVDVNEQSQIICYNLGNFLLDWQEGNVRPSVMVKEQNEGAIFLFDLDKHGICQAVALPTWINDQCQVKWATGEKGRHILRRLSHISSQLDEDYSHVFQRQRVERNMGLAADVLLYHARQGNLRTVHKIIRQVRPKHIPLIARWLIRKLRSMITSI